MSINAKYRRITPDELAVLTADPKSVERFFGLDEFDEQNEDEPNWDEYFDNEEPPVFDQTRFLDILNEWQAIHYLLAGEFAFQGDSKVKPPLCNIVMGGHFFGNVDVGYGPPRYLDPGEVKDAAFALTNLNMQTVRNRLNANEFNRLRIYPGIWRQEDAEMLLNTLHEIKAFFKEAADEGDAMLLWSS